MMDDAPEWITGEVDEIEEPLPKALNEKSVEFLRIAMNQAKTHLEIAEAWADEFPEVENLKAALILSNLSLQKAFESVSDIT